MATERDELVTALTGEWTRLGAELVLLSQAVADRLKINVTDLQCLALLMSAGPLAAGQMAEATGLTTGAITGVVDRLENAGLVARQDDPADRRRVVVVAVGGDVLAAADPETAAALTRLRTAADDVYAGYSERELHLVVDALQRAHPVLLEHVAGLRHRPAVRHELDAPRGGATAGSLVLGSGVGNITIDADPLMTELYRAEVDGPPPVIEVHGGRITVQQRRFPLFGWGARRLRLTLTSAIPWDIEVGRGAYAFSADIAALPLRSLAIKGGASRVEVRLGRPTAVVPITIDGGASKLTVRRPREVPVEVRIDGGAARVSVDGRELGPSARNLQWRPPGIADGAARYALRISGGAAKVVVEGA